jgi:hypothetical protein
MDFMLLISGLTFFISGSIILYVMTDSSRPIFHRFLETFFHKTDLTRKRYKVMQVLGLAWIIIALVFIVTPLVIPPNLYGMLFFGAILLGGMFIIDRILHK